MRVATGVDPPRETALSLHLLQNRQAPLTFDPWRREVRAALRRRKSWDVVAERAQPH